MESLHQLVMEGRLQLEQASVMYRENADLAWNLTLKRLTGGYYRLLDLGDKRVESWPLMSTPWPTALIVIGYLLMCRYGPRLMTNRAPMSLQPLIFLYNLGCAALNFYIGYEIYTTSRQMEYSWICQPVDYSDDPKAVRIAAALWWYYASKAFELLDSLFIILRKREQQLSFLHVYHHATMFPLWWIGAKYVAGGSSFLGAFFNCCVHVVMYSYYALSTLGPRVRKWLWWKKYLTLLQMVQFVAALVMGCNAIRVGCDFPMWMQYSAIIYMVSFLVLFSDFYYKAYVQGRREVKRQQELKKSSHEVTQNGKNGHVEQSNNGVCLNGNGLNEKLTTNNGHVTNGIKEE